jgi:hypothetical protein
MSEDTILTVALAALGVLLLSLGLRTLVDRVRGRPVLVLACRRCRSRSVEQLPSDGVSQNPGYRCIGCELRMRPPGSTFLYVVVLAVSSALSAMLALPLLTGREGPVAVFPFMLVVAGYSVWQLRRPTPVRLSRGTEPAESDAGRPDGSQSGTTPDRPWKRNRPRS